MNGICILCTRTVQTLAHWRVNGGSGSSRSSPHPTFTSHALGLHVNAHTHKAWPPSTGTVSRLLTRLGTRYIATNPSRRTRQPTTLPTAVASMASSASCTAAPLWRTVYLVIIQASSDPWHNLCYFPSGDISPDDTPCSADGGACCPKDWDRLSNSMCFSQDEHHERHSCTDQSWIDERCPWMCTGGKSSIPMTYHIMRCLTKSRQLRSQMRRH